MQYDKKVLLKNISYLIKKKGIKIGELEKSIGVSAGYISRINKKNDGVSTNVDIIYKIAHELGVTMDVLVSVDLEEIGDNEQYLLNFFKSLESKTDARMIFWDAIQPTSIKNILDGEGGSTLDVFKVVPGQGGGYGFDDLGLKKMYVSHFLGKSLDVSGYPYDPSPWFYCKIDDNNTLYITYMILETESDNKEVLEMYMQTEEVRTYFDEYEQEERTNYYSKDTPLCCSLIMGDQIEEGIKHLYKTIIKHQNDIRIPTDVKTAIDKFMIG